MPARRRRARLASTWVLVAESKIRRAISQAVLVNAIAGENRRRMPRQNETGKGGNADEAKIATHLTTVTLFFLLAG